MEVEQINCDLNEKKNIEEKIVDLEEFVKHPLHNEWEFWYLKPSRQKTNWFDNLFKINCFNTVEDFWALYNHIEVPSKLQNGSDYNYFKAGIKPIWEDEKNKNGGRLIIVYKKNSVPPKKIDEVWLEVLLCLIGEAFGDESDQICGAVLNCRPKHDRISIWTSNHKDEPSIRKIQEILRKRTGFTKEIVYELHNDVIGIKSSLYTFES